ncbi:helix-turn-helix domain-containing protein [Streptomyces sp. CWNU-1]|uniref:Helix-turn-helix domain-containing protein n=1 Tax=Streptomyces albipurpureus TaxID=2897419 RepID=A0ABT0UX70_9ACTN|nr:helix-turn-helix domain-containing protein [Streptomyces sp. CWNU-1]
MRRLREAMGLTLDDVQARTPINSVKASRIETARTGVKADDLSTLLDIYGVTDESKRGMLHSLARDGARRGWWQTYRDIISPAYADLISLEADARNLRTFQTTLVPGLLQTSAYARSTITAINMTSAPEMVNALVEVRMARQSVLTRPEPLEVWAIIHEAALRPHMADRAVMRDQLRRLLELGELPHVSIQVLPLTSSPHPGMAGPCTIIGFPESADLDVVLVEHLTSALYVEDTAEVSIYCSAFERLRAAALPVDTSADLIVRLKDSL